MGDRPIAAGGSDARRHARRDLRAGERVDGPTGAGESVAEDGVEHHPFGGRGDDRAVDGAARRGSRQGVESVQLTAERAQRTPRIGGVPFVQGERPVRRDPGRRRRADAFAAGERQRGAHPLRDQLRIGRRGLTGATEKRNGDGEEGEELSHGGKYGDGRRQMADGGWQMADSGWRMADGRKQKGPSNRPGPLHLSANCHPPSAIR